MRRLIDANSLKHSMDKYNYSYFGTNYDKILEVIDEEPTVDLVKHGYWKYDSTRTVVCSNCRYMANNDAEVFYHYCPKCGAKMEEHKDEAETD